MKRSILQFLILILRKSYPLSELCKAIGIQRSSYYKWRNRKESANEKQNRELLPMIQDAYEEKNGILGYRQMTNQGKRGAQPECKS